MSPAGLLECTEVEVVPRRFEVLGKRMPGTLAGVHFRSPCNLGIIVRVIRAGDQKCWFNVRGGTKLPQSSDAAPTPKLSLSGKGPTFLFETLLLWV